MALFLEDSDHDSIATDTTEESEHSVDHSYRVETILAEALDKQGRKKYLVKWEGYALHRATWELRANFDTEEEINDFKARKRAAERGGPPLFDTLEYDEALDIAELEKENKAQRRREKRKKRKKRRETETQTSTKANGAGTAASHKTSQPSPVKKKGVAQKVIKKTQAAKPSKPTNVESAATTRAPKAAEPAKPAAPAKATESADTATAKSKIVAKPTPTAKPAGAAELATIPQPATVPGIAKVAPAAPSTRSTQPAQKTAPSKPLLGSDVPEYKRRQKARITEETPKDSTAPKFRTLSEQNRFQKYSRNEPAPNINAVPLLDPSTGKALPDDLQPAPTRKDSASPTSNVEPVAAEKPDRRQSQSQFPKPSSTNTTGQVRETANKLAQAQPVDRGGNVANKRSRNVAHQGDKVLALAPPLPLLQPSMLKATSRSYDADTHSAYGRRTPPLDRRRRVPSPPIVQPENQVRDQALANVPSNDPIRPPCKFFQTGTCRYTADTCRFSHTYIGTQEPGKRYTCYFWKHGNACWRSAETCEFSHHETGMMASGASQQTCFYWRKYGRCSKTQEQCKFAHFDTGLSAPAPPGFVDKGPLDPSGSMDRGPRNGPDIIMSDVPHAEGPTPRDTQGTTPNDLLPFLSGSASDFFGVPVENSTAAQSGTASASVAEHPPNSHMLYNRSTLEDLKLARESISTLNATKFLSKNGKRIENVYLRMPSERDGERQLLTDFFKALKCEVFDSRTDQHWEFFKTFNPALLVVHPEEAFDGTLPGLAKYLQRSKGWMCSIGVHEDWDNFEQGQPRLTYEARRVFPHGGITFISDDIFEYYPEKATEIIKEFYESSKRKPPGSETSKIGARPGIRDWLACLAQRKMEEGGEDYRDSRYVDCWDAICDLCPLEDYDPYEMELDNMIPKDDALLWSIAEQDLPSFQGLWEKDQAKATDMMASLFAGTGVERMADFQRFCFVYQRPDQAAMSDEVPASQLAPQVVVDHVDPHGWMKKYNHIEVVTPDAWLKMTRERAEQGQGRGVR